jgi:LacI family transcriptional regulator
VALVLELEWPYRRHVDVYLGTQRYAREQTDWECVIDEFPELSSPSRGRDPLAYDGIIARATHPLAVRARRCGVPLVNVWHNSPVSHLPGAFPDFHAAGRLAAEHLLQRGLRRFACVLFPRNRTHQALHQGFRQQLAEAGSACTTHTADADQATRSAATWRRFRSMLNQWVASWQPPLGVFVTHAGYTARHLMNACNCSVYRVPEDVALIVADNDLPVCLQPAPTLTGIDLCYEQAGYEAARLLDQLMKGGPPPAEAVLVEPGGVHARQSTDFFASSDEQVVAAMRFITDHIKEPINVNDVAAAVLTSRRTLERKFQQAAGRCIFAEIRRLRIERAKRLLLDTDLSIKQVAHEAGFRSPVHMYQVFQYFVAAAPSVFRSRKATAHGP